MTYPFTQTDLDTFSAAISTNFDDWNLATNDSPDIGITVVEYEIETKYIRVMTSRKLETGELIYRSIHSFIELATGDIFKAGSLGTVPTDDAPVGNILNLTPEVVCWAGV